MSRLTIRPATEDDLEAILAIHNDAVLNTTATFDIEPRTMEAQRQWFRETQRPYVVLVAERSGEVVGWGSLRPFAARPAYRFTAENSVYVRSDARGGGIGTRVLKELLRAAKDAGFHSVIARVTAENPASVRLHRRLGFRTVGIEREVGYKSGRWQDVAVMQRMVGDDAPG